MTQKLLHKFIVPCFMLLFTACMPAPQATPTPQALFPVQIQLSWIHEYSSAPFHTAKLNGHFEREGLDATLVEGGFNEDGFIDPIQQVLDGEASFAMSDGASLILARAEGKPVVAIAAVLQRSPLAIVSLKEDNITRPQNLAGQRIMVASGGADVLFTSLLQSQGIESSSVEKLERTSFGIDPLLNDETDALVGWIINEGVSVQEQGYEPQFILMSDYGVDTYDFVLFTTESIIDENPAVVQGMINALRSGVQDVINNPGEAIKDTLTFNNSLVQEEQLRRLEATIPLMNVPERPLLSMDTLVWEFTQEVLLEQNLLQTPIDLETVYNLSFTAATE